MAAICLSALSCSSQISCPSSCHLLPWQRQLRRRPRVKQRAELGKRKAKLSKQRLVVLAGTVPVMSTSKESGIKDLQLAQQALTGFCISSLTLRSTNV